MDFETPAITSDVDVVGGFEPGVNIHDLLDIDQQWWRVWKKKEAHNLTLGGLSVGMREGLQNSLVSDALFIPKFEIEIRN